MIERLGSHANKGGKSWHKTYHDPSKVAAHDGVDDHKEVLVTKLAEAHNDTSGEEEGEKLEIHEEGKLGCRLMFGD